LGGELAEISDYNNVDLVIPVPLHKQKLKKRGYNQVEGFGKEIAKSLKIAYCDKVLIKVSKTSSQVFKQRLTRFNTEEIFTVQNTELIKNKHILLVDDIVTTGATLENCASQLLKASNVKISLATMAIV
jgi:ComF family protein